MLRSRQQMPWNYPSIDGNMGSFLTSLIREGDNLMKWGFCSTKRPTRDSGAKRVFAKHLFDHRLCYSKPCLYSHKICSSKFSQIHQGPYLSLHLLFGPTNILCLAWPVSSMHLFGLSCLWVLLWRLMGGPGDSPGPDEMLSSLFDLLKFWLTYPLSTCIHARALSWVYLLFGILHRIFRSATSLDLFFLFGF